MSRVLAAAFAVFLMLSFASVGAFAIRFLAGIAALLGCLGLLVMLLTLLLLYRVMDNPLSNLALLIGASAWAWWFIAKKRREERALDPLPRALSPSERLTAAVSNRLAPPAGRAASISSRTTPARRFDRPPGPRQRSNSVSEAVNRRRARHQLGPRR